MSECIALQAGEDTEVRLGKNSRILAGFGFGRESGSFRKQAKGCARKRQLVVWMQGSPLPQDYHVRSADRCWTHALERSADSPDGVKLGKQNAESHTWSSLPRPALPQTGPCGARGAGSLTVRAPRPSAPGGSLHSDGSHSTPSCPGSLWR